MSITRYNKEGGGDRAIFCTIKRVQFMAKTFDTDNTTDSTDRH